LAIKVRLFLNQM